MADDELVIRVGTPDDIHPLMDLAQAVAGENAPVTPNVHKILQGVWNALHKEGGIIGIVGPRGGAPQGFILLRVGAPWYSDEQLIEENGVYVHPDWRGEKGGRAAMLYRFAKQVADQMQLKLFIGVIHGHNDNNVAPAVCKCGSVHTALRCDTCGSSVKQARSPLDRKMRYYQRFFGHSVGGFYIYDPLATAAPVAAE